MRLTDVLKVNLIKTDLKGTTRDECIQELIDLLAENDLADDKQELFDAIIEREKIMTTGVGNGIAIPHCKTSKSPEFAVSLGLKKDGVDFSAIDDKPVKIVFLLTGPENNPSLHIKLLSRISRLMSSEDLRSQLLDSSDSEEVFNLISEEENYYFEID